MICSRIELGGDQNPWLPDWFHGKSLDLPLVQIESSKKNLPAGKLAGSETNDFERS
jgi:hypothetical protein